MTSNIHDDQPPKKTRGPGKKRNLGKAPRKICPISNPDKKLHEVYKKGDNPLRFPKPFRCAILGGVNSGKSLMATHIIFAHQAKKPFFDEIHIVHGCASTTEYDLLEPTSIRTEIPSYDQFDPDKRTLLVLDDVDFTNMRPDVLKRISQLWRFGSTHCNISIILLHQSWFRIPKIVKDCSSVFVIFRPHDIDELACIGRRVGLGSKKIVEVFDQFLPKWRDSLLINLCPEAPHKYSKNLFEPIDIIDGNE
tara:strand:+ start:533 stop:1282 length:750 start_codon:yes stop_codon:yes gene_type:complete